MKIEENNVKRLESKEENGIQRVEKNEKHRRKRCKTRKTQQESNLNLKAQGASGRVARAPLGPGSAGLREHRLHDPGTPFSTIGP